MPGRGRPHFQPCRHAPLSRWAGQLPGPLTAGLMANTEVSRPACKRLPEPRACRCAFQRSSALAASHSRCPAPPSRWALKQMDPNRNAKALAKVRRRPCRRRAGPSRGRAALRAGCPHALRPLHLPCCHPTAELRCCPPPHLQERKKELARRLGRPINLDGAYEDVSWSALAGFHVFCGQATATALTRCEAWSGSLCGPRSCGMAA